MGHIRLGVLPSTKRWAEVVGLLELGASSTQVAAATLDAADTDLQKAPQDPIVTHTFWLLTQLPDAARSEDYVSALQDLGLSVDKEPSITELTSAITSAIDLYATQKQIKSDLGEMAQLAAIQSVTRILNNNVPALFGTSPSDVKIEISKLATEQQFGHLSKEFFSNFSSRFLKYYTSREIPSHVGNDKSLVKFSDYKDFNNALDVHCKQASKIVEQFSGAWYSKSRFQKTLTHEHVTRFVAYALTKMRRELRRRV